MTVLIDPPTWPAYGRLWSHLVSDVSYAELHRFARSVGIPERGFDLDHYDVPQERYAECVASGAVAVSGRELLTRLQRAGLRVRQIDKPAAAERSRLLSLRAGWGELGRSAVTDGVASGPVEPAWTALGESLLRRWGEPHRHYHTRSHLADVLAALDTLADLGEQVGPVVRAAAWFHDAVYDGRPGEDEEQSARLAARALPGTGWTAAAADHVAELVRGTTPGAPRSDDAAAAVLGDADLAVLAGSSKRYAAYTRAVRAEYAHVPDEAFRAGRIQVLQGILATPTIYRTDAGRGRWESAARANVAAEIERLRDPGRELG